MKEKNILQQGEGVHPQPLSFRLPGQMMTPDKGTCRGVMSPASFPNKLRESLFIERVVLTSIPAGSFATGRKSFRITKSGTAILDETHNSLSPSQRNRLLVTCRHIDRLLADIEATLNAAVSKSVFPSYIEDVSPFQRKLVEGQIGRLRQKLLDILTSQSIAPEPPQISATHSIKVGLTFIDIAVTELSPRHMRGYGAVSHQGAEDLKAIVANLQSGVQDMLQLLAEDRTEKGSKAC